MSERSFVDVGVDVVADDVVEEDEDKAADWREGEGGEVGSTSTEEIIRPLCWISIIANGDKTIVDVVDDDDDDDDDDDGDDDDDSTLLGIVVRGNRSTELFEWREGRDWSEWMVGEVKSTCIRCGGERVVDAVMWVDAAGDRRDTGERIIPLDGDDNDDDVVMEDDEDGKTNDDDDDDDDDEEDDEDEEDEGGDNNNESKPSALWARRMIGFDSIRWLNWFGLNGWLDGWLVRERFLSIRFGVNIDDDDDDDEDDCFSFNRSILCIQQSSTAVQMNVWKVKMKDNTFVD